MSHELVEVFDDLGNRLTKFYHAGCYSAIRAGYLTPGKPNKIVISGGDILKWTRDVKFFKDCKSIFSDNLVMSLSDCREVLTINADAPADEIMAFLTLIRHPEYLLKNSSMKPSEICDIIKANLAQYGIASVPLKLAIFSMIGNSVDQNNFVYFRSTDQHDPIPSCYFTVKDLWDLRKKTSLVGTHGTLRSLGGYELGYSSIWCKVRVNHDPNYVDPRPEGLVYKAVEPVAKFCLKKGLVRNSYMPINDVISMYCSLI